MIKNGNITDGMIPKIENIEIAIHNGLQSVQLVGGLSNTHQWVDAFQKQKYGTIIYGGNYEYLIKHFYSTTDYSLKEINDFIELALKMKNGEVKKILNGKSLGMLFFNPSLRTRVSFTVAMYKLGGIAIDLPVTGSYTFEYEKNAVMDKGTIEHVKDAAGVLSRYCDALAMRASELITSSSDSVDVPSWETLKKDKVIKSFMEYSKIPIINMESNVYHPCQGLGDAMTIKEKLGKTKGKKYVLTWAYHPKACRWLRQILKFCLRAIWG